MKGEKMFCPECGSKTRVIDTRNKVENFETYRRRGCSNPKCGIEFYTIEYEIDETDRVRKLWRSIDRKNISSIPQVEISYDGIDITQDTIGQNMKRARKMKKVGAIELARLSGVSHTTISRYENGHTIPGIFNLITLADALGISLDGYVGREFSTEKKGE